VVAVRLPPAPFLYPIIDLSRVGADGVAAAVASVVDAGARIVQVRAKQAQDAFVLRAAIEATRAAHARGALLVVNDRADVALLAGADGVHVGQEDLSPADVRRVVGQNALVGLSTHNRAQAEAALSEPIDYLAVGPVFATASKVDADAVVGTCLVQEIRRLARVPLVAIGGITVENAGEVVAAGADGVAVISGLWSGGDPGEGARRYLQRLAYLGM
jgi:thiamine-phosphate pyrophosphorylase